MAEPINNKRVSDLAGAPTPQNTPATASSFAGRASAPSVATIKEEDAAGLSGLANNPQLLSMIQGRLGTLVGAPTGYISSLPQPVKDRLLGLRGLQAEYNKVEAQFQAEMLELEKKYFVKYSPLYERRAKIITGEVEPTVDEITEGGELPGDQDEEAKVEEIDDDEQDSAEVKGIPEFWLTALKNMVSIAETISERDEEVLKFLVDVRMEYLDKPGFALVFEFATNPYFSNKTLRKTYYYQEEVGYGGDFIYDHAEGAEIAWTSPEHNVTVKIEKRKQRNKHTKATRTIERAVEVESFFNFFSPPTPPVPAEDDDEDEDDHADDIEALLEMDYQMGEEIKEKLIPRAIDWYTGEALQYEDMGQDYDEDDEEFEDDDDEDDDEDEDDDVPKDKKDPQECNQS